MGVFIQKKELSSALIACSLFFAGFKIKKGRI
jgi:hypothetical protein